MVKDYPPAAWTVATVSRLLVVGPQIRRRAVETSTWLTANPTKTTVKRAQGRMLKYLIIASLVALLLLLLYSKLHPYIKMLGKVLGTVKTLANSGSAGGAARPNKVDGKLIRCVGCGTWVPAGRAVGVKSNLVYCSIDCLQKSSASERRKAAS